MSGGRTGDDVLARITGTPQLARAVPRLPPEVLHAIITHCGLQDCGALLTLATSEQLSAVFDLDLWKSDRPGEEERFDAARFCEWLEALVDADPTLAAERLATMDVALVVAGLAPHVAVFDPAVFSAPVEPSGADAVSNAGRERRRDRLGFLPPQQARAFLDSARCIRLDVEPPQAHVMFAAYRRSPAVESASAVAGVIEVLRAAGALADTRRARLPAARDERSPVNAALNHYLQCCAESGDAAWMAREEELAFLANALVGGCSMQGRPCTPSEAMDAVAATCNLGLAYWPRHWRARGRLDVLASLDLPAWAALTALLDECPVMLANVSAPDGRQPHTVNPSEFQFIADARDIASVHAFLRSLTGLLRS